MDIRLALMTGIDFPIEECQLILHQPTMKEIAMIGEQIFFTGVQTLCIDKRLLLQDKSDLDSMSNFQIFMTIMSEKEAKDKRAAVIQVLALIFPNYKVMTTPRTLIFSKDGQTINVDEENFEFLQERLIQVFCLHSSQSDELTYNPVGDRAKEIAAKLMRGRQRAAELKGGSNNSVFSQYLSVLTIGLHISLTELVNLTMFQLYDLMERYGLYTAWDLDVKSRLAGGKPDSQPDNWMKNIH